MDIRIVDGNLVEDAEIKTSKSGTKYLSFRLANNAYVNKTQVPIFFNVVSYDQRLIEMQNNKEAFVKGKPVVVTGRPTENMTVKDGKAYLNRNLVAISIEHHSFSKKNENSNNTYHSVAPASSIDAPTPQVAQVTVEAPVIPTPTVSAPTPQVAQVTVETPVIPTPVATSPATLPGFSSAAEDDLPF